MAPLLSPFSYLQHKLYWCHRPLGGTEAETRLSTATANASLVAGLPKPTTLSFEAVDLVVLFIF